MGYLAKRDKRWRGGVTSQADLVCVHKGGYAASGGRHGREVRRASDRSSWAEDADSLFCVRRLPGVVPLWATLGFMLGI